MFKFVCPAAGCAEAHKPDEDEDSDAEPQVVHPKTDEQRHRLRDACRDILLFKTLEQVDVRKEKSWSMVFKDSRLIWVMSHT